MNFFFSRPVVVVIQPYVQRQNEIRAIGSPQNSRLTGLSGRHGPNLHHTPSAPPGRRPAYRSSPRLGSSSSRHGGACCYRRQLSHQADRHADDVALPAWRRYRWPGNNTSALPKPPEINKINKLLLSIRLPVNGPKTTFLLCFLLFFTSGQYSMYFL